MRLQVLFKALLLLSLVCFVAGLALAGAASNAITAAAADWAEFAHLKPMVFGAGFTTIFIFLMTLGLPGGAIMCTLSGYFFGPAIGLGVCLFSTTFSALLVNLLVKHASISALPQTLVQQHQIVKTFLKQRPYYAPLLIRMIPVLPFYLVSLLLSCSGVSVRAHLVATAVGGAPTALAFSIIGNELKELVTSEQPSLFSLLQSPMFIAPSAILIGLTFTATLIKSKHQ